MLLSSLSLLAKIPRLVLFAIVFLVYDHFDLLRGTDCTIDTFQNVVDEMANKN
jgi:hypothetical protein